MNLSELIFPLFAPAVHEVPSRELLDRRSAGARRRKSKRIARNRKRDKLAKRSRIANR